jgi:hypothetical protein
LTNFFETELNQYSTVLAENLREVAADLRAIDLADLVSYIRFGSYTTIEDLVHSSTELFFRQGTLSFAWTAGVDLGWGEQPSITMGMEFRHCRVSVFFDLSVRAFDESVTVCGILFEEPVVDPRLKVDVLTDAIAGARLPDRALQQAERPAPLPRDEIP